MHEHRLLALTEGPRWALIHRALLVIHHHIDPVAVEHPQKRLSLECETAVRHNPVDLRCNPSGGSNRLDTYRAGIVTGRVHADGQDEPRNFWTHLELLRILAVPLDTGPQSIIEDAASDPPKAKVTLSARDAYWCQYAYQFAHEFCHVMINSPLSRLGSNCWIEEVFSELASVFVLQRMAEQWEIRPPLYHSSEFASAHAQYANDLLTDPKRTLPVGTSLPQWFLENEPALRSGPRLGATEQWDAQQRNRMAVLAGAFLPAFEEQPVSAWNAVTRLPVSDHADKKRSTSDYLHDWRSYVEPSDRPIVDQIVRMLGV